MSMVNAAGESTFCGEDNKASVFRLLAIGE